MEEQTQGDLGILLARVSDEETVDVEGVIEAVNQAIFQYGFKVRQWGPWSAFRASVAEEAATLKRLVPRGDTMRFAIHTSAFERFPDVPIPYDLPVRWEDQPTEPVARPTTQIGYSLFHENDVGEAE